MTNRVEKPLQQYLDSWQGRDEITNATFDGYKNKLKGRLYGLLCEKEKDGEWEKFLDSLIIELMGLGANSINWWPLLGKMALLRYLSYEFFRKNIFECINLVNGLTIPDELS